jgi:hypothetical protein
MVEGDTTQLIARSGAYRIAISIDMSGDAGHSKEP